MTVSSTWRQVASVIGQASGGSVVPQLAVGQIERISITGSNGEAQIRFGFTPDLIPIPIANWTVSFVAQVRSVNVTGKRVLVAFVDTQPIIVETLGA